MSDEKEKIDEKLGKLKLPRRPWDEYPMYEPQKEVTDKVIDTIKKILDK